MFVGIEGRLDSFYRATLEYLAPDNCTVLFDETEVRTPLHLLPSGLCHTVHSQCMAHTILSMPVCCLHVCMHAYVSFTVLLLYDDLSLLLWVPFTVLKLIQGQSMS